MKKSVVWLMSFAAILFCHNDYAISIDIKGLFTEAINQVKEHYAKKSRWEIGWDVANGCKMAYDLIPSGKSKGASEGLEGKQKKELFAARQAVTDLMRQNADGEIGAYGLPKACDAAVKQLVLLPGGREVLQEIKAIFQEFFVFPKQESKEREQKLSEQQTGERGSILAKLIFWKKVASKAK